MLDSQQLEICGRQPWPSKCRSQQKVYMTVSIMQLVSRYEVGKIVSCMIDSFSYRDDNRV